MTLLAKKIKSPVGPLTLIASPEGLRAILWHRDRPTRVRFETTPLREDHAPIFRRLEKQLQEYFEGRRRAFDIHLDVRGTDFQQQVWKALREIPYGETMSYLDLAKRIGRPNSARAVGAAIGRNPHSIIVPCHRVVGSNGALTGFAGGFDNKKHLLELEGIEINRGSRAAIRSPSI